MSKIGKYNEDDTVTEADECILTGAHVDFYNSVREKVTGTAYFYRVIGHQYDRVTDAHRDYWRAHYTDKKMPLLDEKGVPIPEPKEVSKPAYSAPLKATKASEVKE